MALKFDSSSRSKRLPSDPAYERRLTGQARPNVLFEAGMAYGKDPNSTVLAQLGVTDMRIAIQYALTYPERWDCPLPPLDIQKLARLEFFEPDHEKFPCLNLAYKALRTGGTAPAVLNAADEIVVDAFLNEQIPFHSIPEIIEAVLDLHSPEQACSLDVILQADAWAREEARKLTDRLCRA